MAGQDGEEDGEVAETAGMEFTSSEEELLYQSRHGNMDKVTELLEKDGEDELPNVNCRGNNKSNKSWTPLHLASYFGHYDVVRTLCHHGADVNVINDSGDTPLHKAAYTGRVDVVTLLLQNNADVGIINGEGKMAKHVTKNQEICDLIDATRDVEERKMGEEFISAARHGDIEKVADMLRPNKLKSINYTDKFGNTALHCAAYRGYKEVAVLLIQNGVDMSLKNMNGQTALEMANTAQMRQILDVQPVKELKKNVKRFEGPLYRRSKFLRGWKGLWVVLERGVLSYFTKRADAATGVRRKSFKYLDDAKIELKRDDPNVLLICFSDDTSHTLMVSMADTKVTRQKWLNALNEHISYSTYYTKTGSNYVDEDMEDLLPLGSMQDALETSNAHQKILEKQVAQLQSVVNTIADDRSITTAKAQAHSQLRQELLQIVESSRDMCTSLGHCMTLFQQQEELRKLQLQQEMEKSRVLQDALHVLATEHHELEQSISTGRKSPAKFYDTDDDEFYDCDDDEESLNYNFFECESSVSESIKASMKQPPEPQHRTLPSENLSKWKGRMCLPVPMFSRNDFSVWSILRQCIGKELSKITMPVIFNEPLSFLQRITEYLEYATLLKKACDCDDPIERMQYVCAFAVSASASNWDRLGKPFNPLLGETYELTRDDLGFKIVCEQVSHHPPVSAFHVESSEFIFHGAIHPKLKFWGKSLEVQPKGTVTLELLRHGEVYTWQNINCSVHNIIVGKLWVEHSGVMEIINHTTKNKAVINFKPSGWFARDLHKVEGHIYDKNKVKLKALYGKWVDGMFAVNPDVWENYSKNLPPPQEKQNSHAQNGDDFKDCQERMSNVSLEDGAVPTRGSACNLNLPTQQFLWQADTRPDHSPQYYSFTLFAMMLNEMTDSLRSKLPPTDCRTRPDIRQLEDGNIDLAAEEKVRLEEKQRTARKERKKRKDEWKPRWFIYGRNPTTGKEDWLFTGDYWARDWVRCPDIF